MIIVQTIIPIYGAFFLWLCTIAVVSFGTFLDEHKWWYASWQWVHFLKPYGDTSLDGVVWLIGKMRWKWHPLTQKFGQRRCDKYLWVVFRSFVVAFTRWTQHAELLHVLKKMPGIENCNFEASLIFPVIKRNGIIHCCLIHWGSTDRDFK